MQEGNKEAAKPAAEDSKAPGNIEAPVAAQDLAAFVQNVMEQMVRRILGYHVSVLPVSVRKPQSNEPKILTKCHHL